MKNLLAENMRRFGTKNLNEDDNREYKSQQELVRLNKISDALVIKLRQLSNSDIDVKENETAGNTSYMITQTIQRSSDNGRRVTFVQPAIELSIDPSQETGKITADIQVDTNRGPFSSFSWRSNKTVSIDAGSGMFSKSIDEIVDELIDHLTGIFDLSNKVAENTHRASTKNLNEDGDQNNNGYPDTTENMGGRTVAQIQKDWIRVTTELASLATEYMKPKPDMQAALKLGEQLKATARIKQKLEKEIVKVIASNDRDIHLLITQLL